MEKRNCFFKMLSFERIENGKVAYFDDKFGKSSKVITTFNAIIPGLRYSCKLSKRFVLEGNEDGTETRVYKMYTFRVWIDDIQVLTEEEFVKVLLEGKEVEALTFGYGFSLNVEERVEELNVYFKHKTFQLSSGKDIEKFISVYRESCESIAGKDKKILKREKKKKVKV